MTDLDDPCLACRIVAGEARTAGGVVLRADGFTVHALAGPAPIAGWLVVTSDRHARAVYDLEDDEAAALGRLAARVMRAQRSALGAEHVYAFAIGDALLHAHLHLVPRYAGTPARLRGRGAFDFAATEVLGEEELRAAAERVGAALASAG